MLGIGELYTALNVTAITNLLDTYSTGKALFIEPVIPEKFTGSKSINAYMTSPANGALEYELYNYSASCRAKTAGESRTIAQAVHDAINRVNYTDYYIVSSIGVTIPPQDDTDNFNTPVEIIIKKR